MIRWRPLAAGSVLALAAVAAVVPGAAGGFTATVRQDVVAATASAFRCGDAQAPDAASAVFQWSLADTGAVAADASGRGHTGTYRGVRSTTEDAARACRRDGTRAWVLDGSSSFVHGPRMSQPFSTTAFTLEARIRAPASTTGGDVLSSCDSATATCGSRDDRLYLGSTGRLVFGTYGSGEYFQILESAASLTDGRWHHVAGRLSAAGMQLYIDGTDVTGTATAYRGSTASHSAGWDPKAFTTTRPVQGYWRVGGTDGSNWPRWAKTWFAGSIGWAAVYSTALEPARIRARWAAGR